MISRIRIVSALTVLAVMCLSSAVFAVVGTGTNFQYPNDLAVEASGDLVVTDLGVDAGDCRLVAAIQTLLPNPKRNSRSIDVQHRPRGEGHLVVQLG